MSPFIDRSWTFISERFPLGSHLPMIASFVAANALFGTTLNGSAFYSAARMCLGFIVAFSFFLRLRLFDEIKDYETDLIVNPTRPLARGLIKVSEVKIALALLCLGELLIVVALSPQLAASHLLGMLYSFLMYREFFIGSLIRPHLTTYAVLHTVVSSFIGATVISVVTNLPIWNFSSSLLWLLLANWGYFNLFEFARKTFAPSEERNNVESYSKIFSVRGAILLSLSQAIVPLLIFARVLESRLSSTHWAILCSLLLMVTVPSVFFWVRPHPVEAKRFRNMTGLFLVVAYTSLALILGLGVSV